MPKHTLGERMKRYEAAAHAVLTPRMPVVIRVDGRAFHTFTKDMQKPFDPRLMEAMQRTMVHTANTMQGCKFAYTQSDEISFLLTDDDTIDTQGWFGYEVNKMVSAAAATASVALARCYPEQAMFPTFDARAFNIPREDVANYFLWRAKDWERNSLQMYAQAFFSPQELHGKKHAEIHQLLFGIGKNWTTDLSDAERNGTWYHPVSSVFPTTMSSIYPPRFKMIWWACQSAFPPLPTGKNRRDRASDGLLAVYEAMLAEHEAPDMRCEIPEHTPPHSPISSSR